MSTELFCTLIFYHFFNLWNHHSTQLQVLHSKTISSMKITFWDSEMKSKMSKGKRIVTWCLYTYMCIKLLFFSWNPAVQILPPTVYTLFTIYRNMNQMYFSPLLRLLCGTINDYLDGLDWVSPVEKCCCCCLVTKLCLTLCELMDYGSPGSSVRGILQTGILEWVAIPVSRGFSPPREWTWVSCIGRRVLYHWATREVLC